MAIAYLGLGSNKRPEDNLRLCVRELRQRFSVLAISPVYKTKAIGFEGSDFLNAVACIETQLSPADICQQLDEIHVLSGRERGESAFMSRTLDIDLLLYDDLIIDKPPVRVPRDDVLDYAFVLGPLAEIAPGYVHPTTGKSIDAHWAEFESGPDLLRKYDLDL
ncbi:MAG: 2-amino-4-hydroxy-6-hydroxymethyldihydropteridine diphosphokinase [Woeseiaceae bacterium]